MALLASIRTSFAPGNPLASLGLTMKRLSISDPRDALAHVLPRWFRHALVKALTGLCLGLITAVTLVYLSQQVFPGVQAYGEDLGLRVSLYFERVASSTSGVVPPRSDSDRYGYVFLDVDPEPTNVGLTAAQHPSPSEQACAAYTEARHSRITDTTPPEQPLDCSSARPLNRHLLAAIVRELQRRQARLVILDLVLARESGIVNADEDQALQTALKQVGTSMPVLFAGPYEMQPTTATGQPGPVQLVMPLLIEDNQAANLHPAVALPVPGQPLRRYPKCLRQAGLTAWLPSLPYLAAMVLVADGATCEQSAASRRDNAPRIVFSLPSQSSHLDDLNAPGRAHQAIYRGRYDRCLATHFWNSETSLCAQAATYHDKVVVIGVSNPLRRDRHYTPLGDMAGPEVVINAVRSFVAYPQQHDKSLAQLISKKCLIVAACFVLWLLYFSVRCRCFPEQGRESRSLLAVGWRALLVGLAFIATLLLVLLLAFSLSFDSDAPTPSLDVLIPVLAIAIDEYVEQVHRLVRGVEHQLEKLLCLSPHP